MRKHIPLIKADRSISQNETKGINIDMLMGHRLLLYLAM